jgi:uncharacterized protein (DUF1697 family)
MPIGVAFIRGINVGGKNVLPMAMLRELCVRAGLRDVRTHIQSGNVAFRAGAKELAGAGEALAKAIEGRAGFRPAVMVRTLEELRRIVSANPFAAQAAAEPGKVLVMFLAAEPTAANAREAIALVPGPEQVRHAGREMYLYFPSGAGKSRLSVTALERTMGTLGTCRNWNTTTKMLGVAEELRALE